MTDSADPRVTLTRLQELAGKTNDTANLLYEVASIMHDQIEEVTDFDPSYYAERCAESAHDLAAVRHSLPVLTAALRQVLDVVDDVVDDVVEQNRPPNATNSEVIWLAGDLRSAVAAALVGLNPTGEALKRDPGNLNDGGSDSSFANPTEET